MNESGAQKSPEALLERLKEQDRARLRVYIGAAPGVGKTYAMLREAHALKARGVDVVAGLVETYGRPDTEAQLQDLEVVPRACITYKGATLEEALRGKETVAEGVATTQSAMQLAERHDVDMPIVEMVHRILFDGHAARNAVPELMARELRSEQDL